MPIIGDGHPGDPCSSGGIAEATDDYDATSICWDVEDVDGESVGTCIAPCTGTPDDPVCADGTPGLNPIVGENRRTALGTHLMQSSQAKIQDEVEPDSL